MATNADAVTVDWDEDGLHLYVHVDEATDPEALYHDFRVANPEELYMQAVGAIKDWLDERDAARSSWRSIEDDAADGYALDDPKHPTYHDRMSGLHDNRAGK